MGSRRLVRDYELRTAARNIRDVDLPCHDLLEGEAIGIKNYTSHLFKPPPKKIRLMLLRCHSVAQIAFTQTLEDS